MATAAPTQEEIQQLERGLMEKTLDKAASDPDWKQKLLDDPQAAIETSGFPEAQRMQEIRDNLKPYDPEADEVRGHDDLVTLTVCVSATSFWVQDQLWVVYT